MTAPVELSREYVRGVRRDEDVTTVRRALAQHSRADLSTALADRRAATAFWVNVYNASVQHHLEQDASLFEARWFGLARPILRRRLVTVAGHDLSLDDVEHGVLRASRAWWGLGYVPRLFPDAFERAFRLPFVDARVHFALNCGARSCPPIATYSAGGLDDELDRATRSYLDAAVSYDPESNVARVSRLFRWYRGDFGGSKGVVSFLRHHDAIPPRATPRLRYRTYDWTLELGQYR